MAGAHLYASRNAYCIGVHAWSKHWVAVGIGVMQEAQGRLVLELWPLDCPLLVEGPCVRVAVNDVVEEAGEPLWNVCSCGQDAYVGLRVPDLREFLMNVWGCDTSQIAYLELCEVGEK